MFEPRSTATIRALASLAEISANQLEEGASVEEVIATLRKAAEAVRLVVDSDEALADELDDTDLAQDLTPMELVVDAAANADEADESEQPVLNAS